MKRCPECRRDYYDDTLLYCLDDGVQLLDGPATSDGPRTAILGSSERIDEAATKIQAKMTGDITKPEIGRYPRSRMLMAGAALVIVILTVGGYLGFRYSSVANVKQIESIAVLPFVNDSNDPDVEYLSDGMTETLIGSLSRLPNLSVKARSSVFRYKGKDTDPKTIAKELAVQAILNGHVSQRGDTLILSLELIDASSENVIWSEQYNRKQADLVSLQSEIARDVSNKLRSKITGEQEAQVAKKYTDNPEAYRLYLQGRYCWNKRKPEELAKAVQYFEQAIALDPNYALAYSGIADCYAVESSPIKGPERDVKVRSAIDRAIQLDSTLGQPHAALANMFASKRDWGNAEKEYKIAIQLTPESPSSHQWYAETLTRLGRHDEAIAEIRQARELDPLSLVINSDTVYILSMARRYDEAVEHAQKVIEMDKTWALTYWHLTETYELTGKYERALQEEEKWIENSNLSPAEMAAGKNEVAQVRAAYNASGAEGYWRQRLELVKKHFATDGRATFYMGVIYNYLGDKDEAFKWFSMAVDKDEEADLLKVYPSLDTLRDDPRYKQLLKRMNFPE